MPSRTPRLPPPYGLLIDRARPLSFRFEGLTIEGFAGDTLASAILANGIAVLSRSFKYHRPRGPLSLAGQDANTLVQLPGEPNVPADRRAAADGLEVSAQHCTSGLFADRERWIERFARFLPVGFYYKAFYRPRGAWDRWEPFIRRKAGLGRVALDAPRPYADKQYLFADVAVIGGGSAGLHAALAAAESGAEVLLVEETLRLGGALLYTGSAGAAAELAARGAAQARITVLTDAVCTGWFADHWLAVVRGHRLLKVRAQAVVVATGAIEQPLVFRNNDLPGILLGSAALRLIHLYAVRPGQRAVVATANADGYQVADALAAAGVEIAAVVDLRTTPPPASCRHRVLIGHTLWEAKPDRSGLRVGAVAVAPVRGDGRAGAASETIACDLVTMSVGYAPAAQLLAMAGARLGYDERLATFAPGTLPPGLFAAGAAVNAWATDAVAAEGRLMGWRAAALAGHRRGDEPPAPAERGAEGLNHPFPCFPHPRGKDFVDLDEDLQVADIENAVADGYDHIELVKRYSTVGMGPSQGRQSALATIRLVGRATGRDPAEIGATTVRPPAVPEAIGTLAGRGFEPERLTPMHHRHRAAGAQMMTAGVWWRPAYYGAAGQRHAAIVKEVRAVRAGVGLIDVSTLGGIEVRGPDAAAFLERVYVGAYRKQPVGRLRYALMCDETGAIIDDGVACRLADDHFYVTATTSGADAVHRQMLWWNAQWRLNVDLANVTAALCGITVAGPSSRAVLGQLVGDDLSAAALPYLGVRSTAVAGIPCRLLRTGFVGELAYEVHAPAGFGEALWDALVEAGREAGIRPVGIEAQRVLRLEKGHVIVGQDTDGLTHPLEAGMGWAIGRNKPFFVGGRSIEILSRQPPSRRLVGFVLPDDRVPMPEECHLTVRGDEIVGHVTSVARSPSLGKVVGLAYVAPDQGEPGSRFEIKTAGGRRIEAEVTALPFYDPANARQDAAAPVAPTRHKRPGLGPRRSFIHPLQEEAGARFAERGDALVAWTLGGAPEAEAAVARRLGLSDLTPLPRTGFKGRDALAWLTRQGAHVGDAANRAYRQPDGSLLVKLAATEALILGDPAATTPGPLLDGAAIPAGQLCFPVPRRDGSLWFRVTGEEAPAFFAKLCGVDLRRHRFPDGEVAQTSLARMSGVVIRDDCGAVPVYHIVADSASAAYFWRVLLDAAAEFDGSAIGLAALLALGRG